MMKKQIKTLSSRTAPFNGLTLLLLMGCSGGSALRVPQSSPADANTQDLGETSYVDVEENISSDDFSYDLRQQTELADASNLEIIQNPNDHSGQFTITNGGELIFDTPTFTLDFEDVDNNEFTLAVSATDEEGSVETITLILRLIDVNDEAPLFALDAPQAIELNENTAFSQSFAALPDVAGDVVNYSLIDDFGGIFVIDQDGVVTATNTALDFESGTTTYLLSVVATVGDQSATHEVTITVTDVADGPLFNASTLTATVAENDNSSLFHQVTATSSNGPISYSLASDYDGPLEIVGDVIWFKTGEAGFDFETDGDTHIVPVIATDSKGITRTDVVITITDVADGPVFDASTLTATVAENDTSSLFHFLSATSDEGAITYRIAEGYDGPIELQGTALWFKTGALGFDYETDGDTHIVPVIASDSKGETQADMVITITDVVQEPIFTAQSLAVSVDEGDADSLFHTIEATSSDGPVTYSVGSGYNGPLEIANGVLWFKTGETGFDRGSDGTAHKVPVIATDANGVTAHGQVIVSIMPNSEFLGSLPVATEPVHGTTADDILAGSDKSEIIQGSDGDDTITTGAGNDVIVGGAGNDTITLGAGTKQIVYRFTSDDNGNWAGSDGSDIIHNFTRGVDKLLFTDTNANGIESLADFVTQAQQNSHLGITLLQDASDNYTGLVFNFDETDQNGMLQINFDNPLSDDLVNDLGLTGTSLAKSQYQHLNRILNDDILSENFDITTDVTPSDLDVL